MDLGGFRNERVPVGENRYRKAMVANVFDFTVAAERADLIEKIKKALETGERITLTYDQRKFNNPCTTSSGYFITAVH